MFGVDPTHISTCVPSTVRPSISCTVAPLRVAVTPLARARLTSLPPRLVNTHSMTAAAAGSSPGSTWSRLDTRVVGMPISRYPLANSAPVTPEPTTTRWPGISLRSYTWRQDRIRLPSGSAPGRMRGDAPVATSTMSDSSDAKGTEPGVPSVTSTWKVRPGWASENRPTPGMIRTPDRARRCAMSWDCWMASALTRRLTACRSTVTASGDPGFTPIPGALRNAVTFSLVAIRRLLGTQSHSTHEPPMPSRSTTVTSAPRSAATSAAS